MYRDNNNRVTPDAQQGLNLQPSAAPVNQEIRYKFDTSRAEKTKALADGLARLGKGMVDIDPVLESMADQNVAKAQLEAGENKDKWNEVSSKIKGMAMFNPYNRDAHERLKSENICKATLLEAQGKPDFEKLSPEDANKYLQDAKQRTIEALQKSGVKPVNYSKALLDFDTKMKAIDDNYQVKHQAYQYKLTNNSYQHSLTTDLEIAMTQGGNKPEALKNVLNTYSDKMTTECGIPKEQQAVNLLAGIQNYIASNPTGISSAELLTSLKGLKVNGTDIAELIPDYEVKMRQIVRTAQRADYDDRALELSNKQLTENIKAFDAQTEFYKRFSQSDKSYTTAKALAAEISKNYDLGQSGLGFMNSCLSTAENWNSFNITRSDPNTMQQLGLKAYTGELTQGDIKQAVDAGKLNYVDCFNLTSALNKSNNEGSSQFKLLVSDLNNTVINSKGAFHRDFSKEEMTDMTNAITDLKLKVDSGELTPQQGYQALQKYSKRVQQLRTKNVSSKNKWQKIYNGAYRAAASKAYYNKYGTANLQESTNALKSLGMVATRYGGADKNISANARGLVGTQRNGYYHVGTDVNGVAIGRSVLAPSDLKLVYTNYEQSMGNYAVFQDNYGRYIVLQHLNNKLGYKAGTTFKRGTAIGTIGNSGRADAGGCLHIEFWTKDLNLLSPQQYLKGIS